MSWWGTAVGGALGLAVGGPVGAIFGAALGRGVDRGVEKLDLFHRAGVDRAQLQERFFAATFSVLGHLCKADGRVSEVEIAFTQAVMGRMGLGAAARRAAIDNFAAGKRADFDLARCLAQLRKAGLGQGPLLNLFLEVQIAAAYADGPPTPAQQEILEHIRRGLFVPAGTFKRLERLIQLQQQVLGAMGGFAGGFRGGPRAGPGAGAGTGGTRGQAAPSPAATLAGAYATLGVTPKASDEEVKHAYRRLMSQHHPDKLMSRGAPESAIELATRQTHEIRRAYETVSRARGGSAAGA